MTATKEANKPAEVHKIEYLSRPAEVSMTDGYFELASLDHFWVRRRFGVFRALAGSLITGAHEMAEVGCGHGILQRQIEQAYGREVTGFDLNENGLKHNLSQFSRVCCYDIHEMLESLRARFDLIFLWDVLEHIPDEDKFLRALVFHMAPGGRLVVNVPAGQWAYSGYDRAAGHVRRYSIHTLREVAERNRLELLEWSYWGLPLLPVLFVRKLRPMGKDGGSKAYSAGFDTRTANLNRTMGLLAQCEVLPQKLLGTSLMAVLQVR
jgi:SAM-dependent methyltransferase